MGDERRPGGNRRGPQAAVEEGRFTWSQGEEATGKRAASEAKWVERLSPRLLFEAEKRAAAELLPYCTRSDTQTWMAPSAFTLKPYP